MRCKSRNKSGKPCGSYAGTGSKYCFTHDPALSRQRAKAHRDGGRHHPSLTDTPWPAGVDAKTGAGLLSLMEAVLQATWRLEDSLARGRTLGYLVSIQKSVLEVGELEARVAALEQVLKGGQNNERDSVK